MSAKRSYKRYPDAFKEEAVALVTEQGYSVADAAQSLGIRPNQLYDWKAKQVAKGSSSLTGDERRELIELHLYRRTKAIFAASRNSLRNREMMKKLREEGFNVGRRSE